MSRADQSLSRDDAEDVVGERVERAPGAQSGRRRRRSRARPRCRGGGWGRRSAPPRSAPSAGPGADDVGAGDDDGAGPAVVADGQVLPVRRQRLPSGRKIRPRWWRGARRRRSRRSRRPRTGRCRVTRRSGRAAARRARGGPRRRAPRRATRGRSPRLAAHREEGVEAPASARPWPGRTRRVTEGRHRREVEHEVTDPYADPGLLAGGREDAVRQVVHVEDDPAAPRPRRRVIAELRSSTVRSSCASLTQHEPNEVNHRRAPARSVVTRAARAAPSVCSRLCHDLGGRRAVEGPAGRHQDVEEAVVRRTRARSPRRGAARRGAAPRCT